jgi:putative acetyltransferase
MRTHSSQLRKGAAAAMLEHIVATAKMRGYARLSLETGSTPDFDAAHGLYLRHGFEYCPPFGDYVEDPFSRYMTLVL